MLRIHSPIDALPIVRHKIESSIVRSVGLRFFQRIFMNRHFANAITLIAQSPIKLSGKFKVHRQIHRMTVGRGVGRESDELIVDVHISRILKLSHNARALFVQHRQIERHSLVEQGRCRVALHLFAHSFIVKLAINIDHIHTLPRMQGIAQVHPPIVHCRIHRHRCLQITFRTKG